MNLQRLFPRVGKVIASTGSRHFPRLLHDLILTEVPVDATYITEQRIGTGNISEPSLSSLGYVGMDTHAAQPFLVADEMFLEDTHPHQVPNFPPCLPKQEDSDRPATLSAKTQLHLTTRKNGRRYVLSVYRSPFSQGFSAQEHALLRDFSRLLLPMVEEHVAALAPAETVRNAPHLPLDSPENGGMEALRQRFADRLLLSGLSLSSRETQVCVGLLAGRTAPELAEQLHLKVTTVESYLRRAAIKLGIGGRRSLIRWMHSMDATPTLFAWAGTPQPG